jgi:hypothetical protein
MNDEYTELTDSEKEHVSQAVFEIMKLMSSLDEKGISFRCCLIAFLFTITSSFEVIGYSKKRVKDVFQNIINNYDREESEEVEEEA